MADEKKESKKFERIYTVNLSKAYEYLRTRRVERAVKLLRAFIARHMKADEGSVRISSGVNSLLWRDSIQKPPRRIKVRLVSDEGKVMAWLVGEEEAVAKKAADEKAKKEEAKKKAEGKKPQQKKEEKKTEAAPKEKEGEKKAEKRDAAPKAADSKSPSHEQMTQMPSSRNQI
jgi:large subunit ribosomal protein L31e